MSRGHRRSTWRARGRRFRDRPPEPVLWIRLGLTVERLQARRHRGSGDREGTGRDDPVRDRGVEWSGPNHHQAGRTGTGALELHAAPGRQLPRQPGGTLRNELRYGPREPFTQLDTASINMNV